MADFSSESLDLQKKVKEEDDNIKPMKEFESPEKLYDELIASVRKYHPSTDISLIEKAYHVARDAHEGQARKSGEPYIIHPLCVAIILAELELDKETIVAGLLHDVAKEIPALELAAIVSKSSLDVCDIEKKAVPLFHGIAGAELVQTLFDIHDPEIISAIRYHTVACGNMPKLSQIVYLADLISADRDYKDVKKMRKYAEQSLEKAMFEALKFSIKDSVEKGNTIPVSTLEAYNDFADNSK